MSGLAGRVAAVAVGASTAVVLVALATGGAVAARSVGVGVGVLLALALLGAASLRVAALAPPVLTLMIALTTYATQVLLLGLVFVALRRSGLLETTLDRRWLGLTVIAGTVLASALVALAALRAGPGSGPLDPGSDGPSPDAEPRDREDVGGG